MIAITIITMMIETIQPNVVPIVSPILSPKLRLNDTEKSSPLFATLEYSSCLLIFISLGIFTTGGVTIGVAGGF